jgi:DNA-binding transcriptional LysR family regulator
MQATEASSGRRPSADDLLVLLAVGRSGRYNTAAEELGLNHTTISRRIAALEATLGGRVLARVSGGWELTDLGREALSAAEAVESAVRSLTVDPGGARTLEGVVRISATDGFSAYIAAPAAAQVQRRHPKVAVEIVAATRRATQQRSGLDVEVVVGEPQVHRAKAIRLADYCLGLYGSRNYLAEHGTPASIADLARYPLVYFIDSMLQVVAVVDAIRERANDSATCYWACVSDDANRVMACRSSSTPAAAPTTGIGLPQNRARLSSSYTASASTPASTTGTASRSTPPVSICGPSTSSGTA